MKIILDDTELTKVWKFLKRSVAAFLTSHAIQYSVDNEKLDARILDNEIGNGNEKLTQDNYVF